MLEEVLSARDSGKKDKLSHQLKECSAIVNQRQKPKQNPVTLDALADEIQVIDGALENLHDEQYHLEDYLDRALESQWQYRELLVSRSHENQMLQMELDGLHEKSSVLKNCVINSASLMDLLHEKEMCATRCDCSINSLRRIIREVKEVRSSANVELQVTATVAAGLQAMGTLGNMGGA